MGGKIFAKGPFAGGGVSEGLWGERPAFGTPEDEEWPPQLGE